MKPRTRDEWADFWAVRLEGGPLTETEREALEAWVDSHPDNRALLSASCQFLADLERELPKVAAAHEILAEGDFAEEPDRRAASRRNWIIAASAAAILLLASLVVYMRRQPVLSPPAAIATASRMQPLTLVDGSRAELNTRTELRVDYSDARQRLVKMDRGEAMFTVAKNPDRPFVVETPAGRVRVTGTVFNVRIDPAARLEVTVLDGTVEVLPTSPTISAEPVRLKAGDQVTVETAGLAVKRLDVQAAANVTAWRENQIVFNGTTLADALSRFDAATHTHFEIAPSIAVLRVGGRFNLNDLDGFLVAVEGALPVRVARTGDGVVHLEPK